MPHEIIIIRRKSALDNTSSAQAHEEVEYEYSMQIPHGSTPAQVGEMARKAYRRLEVTDGD